MARKRSVQGAEHELHSVLTCQAEWVVTQADRGAFVRRTENEGLSIHGHGYATCKQVVVERLRVFLLGIAGLGPFLVEN